MPKKRSGCSWLLQVAGQLAFAFRPFGVIQSALKLKDEVAVKGVSETAPHSEGRDVLFQHERFGKAEAGERCSQKLQEGIADAVFRRSLLAQPCQRLQVTPQSLRKLTHDIHHLKFCAVRFTTNLWSCWAFWMAKALASLLK